MQTRQSLTYTLKYRKWRGGGVKEYSSSNLFFNIVYSIFKVVENPVISMGVFIVGEGESIPLHDHPNMHGIIKCLQGRLRIRSFSRKVNWDKIIDKVVNKDRSQ